MKRRILIAMLLALATLPAAADESGTVFAPALGKLAQLTPDERRALRERWENASPEERVRMRRAIQERMRQMPVPMMDPRQVDAWRDNGFGRGYEHRQGDDAEALPPQPGWPVFDRRPPRRP